MEVLVWVLAVGLVLVTGALARTVLLLRSTQAELAEANRRMPPAGPPSQRAVRTAGTAVRSVVDRKSVV